MTRIGFGYDIHRLKAGRRLVIGGVEVPSAKGAVAHSDGDVLIHAAIDALLGAASLGDIGAHYPAGEPETRGISSRLLLQKTSLLLKEHGVAIINLDCTVILEKPRILPYVEAMKNKLSEDLDITPGAISVKGKTKEGMDSSGRGRAIEAYAVVLVNLPQVDLPQVDLPQVDLPQLDLPL